MNGNNILVLAIISSFSVLTYFWFFQVSWKKALYGILIGGPASFLASLVLEEISLTYLSMLIVIIIFAPIIEESMKFVATRYGRNTDAGIGVGMGFALLENALYYSSFFYMFNLIFVLREFSDPILHGTTTSVATFTWKKKYLSIGAAIGMHMGWNVFAVLTSVDPFLVIIPSVVFFAVLYAVRNKEKLKILKN